MSHDEAVRSFAVEEYLLEELSVESRDELKNIYSIVRSVPWILESEQPSSC